MLVSMARMPGRPPISRRNSYSSNRPATAIWATIWWSPATATTYLAGASPASACPTVSTSRSATRSQRAASTGSPR